MASTEKAGRFDGLLAQGVQRLREQRGWSQSDFAHHMRRTSGLPWTRDTIAAVERGTRKLAPSEWLAACFTLDVELGAPLPAEGSAVIGPELVITNSALRRLLAVDVGSVDASAFRGRLKREAISALRTSSMVMRECFKLAEGTERQVKVADVLRWEQAGMNEAEKNAAKRLAVHPTLLSGAAFLLWGRSLTEERDQRLEGVKPGTLARGHRGHITRSLVDELRSFLAAKRVPTGQVVKKKGRTGR